MVLLDVLFFPDGESVVIFESIEDGEKAAALGGLLVARLEICFDHQEITLG
jgi:hypothetical protein